MMKGHAELVELLKTVQGTPGHILATDEASVCEYQDMIGHSSQEQLKELANGVYKETFYKIYGLAYGTVEAIRFFTKNSEKIEALLHSRDNLQCDLEEEKEKTEKAKEEAKKNFDTAARMRDEWEEEKKKVEAAKKELDEAHSEIILLKAKLYDLMQK